MSTSLKDYQDFILLWVKKRTGVHLGDLVIYPAMVRHCLCCHASRGYAHGTNGLCSACREDQSCARCGAAFEPDENSVGVFCPACWGALESTWKSTFVDRDPVSAEAEVRTFVISARPRLTACKH